jgi:hypothetical protein
MVERRRNMTRTLGYMRVEGEGGRPASEIRGLLKAWESAYQIVARIELEGERVIDFLEWLERVGPPRRYWSPFLGMGTVRVEGDVGSRLIVSRVVLESPGFWEVFGSLNPLEVLRKYLNDRHERSKDRNYRSDAEHERLAIANALGRLQVVERIAAIEREYGPGFYDSEAWLRGWEADLRPQLERLTEFDRRGLIAGKTATTGPEPQNPRA